MLLLTKKGKSTFPFRSGTWPQHLEGAAWRSPPPLQPPPLCWSCVRPPWQDWWAECRWCTGWSTAGSSLWRRTMLWMRCPVSCFFLTKLIKKLAVSRTRIWIRIRRIRLFLGLLAPDPDPLVRDTDPDPSSSKNSKKSLDSYCFVTSFLLFIASPSQKEEKIKFAAKTFFYYNF